MDYMESVQRKFPGKFNLPVVSPCTRWHKKKNRKSVCACVKYVTGLAPRKLVVINVILFFEEEWISVKYPVIYIFCIASWFNTFRFMISLPQFLRRRWLDCVFSFVLWNFCYLLLLLLLHYYYHFYSSMQTQECEEEW